MKYKHLSFFIAFLLQTLCWADVAGQERYDASWIERATGDSGETSASSTTGFITSTTGDFISTTGDLSSTTLRTPPPDTTEKIQTVGGGSSDAGATLAVAIVVPIVGVIFISLGILAFFIYRRLQMDGSSVSDIDLAELPAVIDKKQHVLQSLDYLLLEEGFSVAKAISKATAVTESDRVAKEMVTVFESHGKTVELIKAHISIEVKQANHAGSLMRANSMASKLMKSLSSMIGKRFLQDTLGDLIKEICINPNAEGISFEVDPDKIKPTETLAKNQEKLLQFSSKILRRIFDSLDSTPLEFRQICNTLQRKVAAKFPGSAQLCIGGFLFLRYFCPAIVAPMASEIIKTPPNEPAQRGLTLIAKVLQNIANGVTFGKKEHFLEWLNPFITENLSACQDYFDEIAIVPDDAKPASSGEVDQLLKSKALEFLVKHTCQVFPKIKEKCATKIWFISLDSIIQEQQAIEEQASTRNSVSSNSKRKGSTGSVHSVITQV